GYRVEKHHHEVATAGQAEIDLRFLSLVKMGDALMWYKHIVKNVARRYGKTATFMPKPIFADNGSGMHTHQSIWKGEKPLNPGDPLDKDIYALTPEELRDVPKMPGSLDEALDALKRDHDFLLKGDVFTEDVVETWIEWKMANEVNAIRLRPHPYEFALYFDA